MFNRAALIFFLVVTSNLLMGTPLRRLHIYTTVAAVVIWAVLYFPFAASNKRNDGKEIDRSLGTFVTLMLAAGCFYAVLPRFMYGQSLIDGVFGSLDYSMILIIAYLYLYFKKAPDPIGSLEKMGLMIGWIALFVSYYILIVHREIVISVASFDGSTDYEYEISIVGYPFILWSGFIYLARTLKRFSLRHILTALLFFIVPPIANNGRQYVFYLSLTLLFFVVRNRRIFHAKRILTVFAVLAIIFLAGLCIYPKAVHEFLEQKVVKVEDAYHAITAGDESITDSSALARIGEVGIALESIARRPFFGVGTIRAQNQMNYAGGYFYSNDLGIIGLLYNYGIVGIALFSYVFVYVVRCLKYERIDSVSPFIQGNNYCLFYFSISSLTTGSFIYSIGWFYFLLGISLFGIKAHHQSTLRSCPRE